MSNSNTIDNNKKYLVVDLENWSVDYLERPPAEEWTDEYKTKKLVLKKITKGKFKWGEYDSKTKEEIVYEVTLTSPFYLGVFQVTQKQYELITGKDPSIYKGATRPVENVSYEDIRGTEKGAQWPLGCDVDEDSFLGKLRAKTNLAFDLPTEAQWEYACGCQLNTTWNNHTHECDWFDIMVDGDAQLSKVGRYFYNGGEEKRHAPVGSYDKSFWGHYDMHGNVYEWCLDWFADYSGDVVDPKGPEKGEFRIIRGGCWSSGASRCSRSHRNRLEPEFALDRVGFRLVLVQ